MYTKVEALHGRCNYLLEVHRDATYLQTTLIQTCCLANANTMNMYVHYFVCVKVFLCSALILNRNWHPKFPVPKKVHMSRVLYMHAK